MRSPKIAVEIISALLVLLWVYAALSKFIDFKAFNVQLGKSPLISSFSGIIAIIVPFTELVIAFLLFSDKTRLAGLYASVVLLILFTIYLIWILNFSPTIPCACGGILQSSLGWKSHIVFNLACAFLAATGIFILKAKTKHRWFSQNQLAA